MAFYHQKTKERTKQSKLAILRTDTYVDEHRVIINQTLYHQEGACFIYIRINPSLPSALYGFIENYIKESITIGVIVCYERKEGSSLSVTLEGSSLRDPPVF